MDYPKDLEWLFSAQVGLATTTTTITTMDAAKMSWTFSNLSELHDKFGWEEYVVLASVLLISALIGVYWAYKGQNTTSEFLMASKQMTLFPTTMSLTCR
jgi:hypothetical protein